MNNLSLSGRVGVKPVIHGQESGGEKVATFSLAVAMFWTKNGQKQDKTNWIPIVAFGRNAEIVEKHVTSGKLVGITGSLNQKTWVDASTGETKSSLEVIAEKIDFYSFDKAAEEQN